MKIEVVLFDRRDEPLSAADSSKTLEETGAQEELQQETGLPVEINVPPDQGGVGPAGRKPVTNNSNMHLVENAVMTIRTSVWTEATSIRFHRCYSVGLP